MYVEMATVGLVSLMLYATKRSFSALLTRDEGPTGMNNRGDAVYHRVCPVLFAQYTVGVPVRVRNRVVRMS